MVNTIGLSSEDFEPIREAYRQRDTDLARQLMTDEMADLAIYGTPEDCLKRISNLIKKGISHFRFGPPLGPDPAETIRLIGEEIIPQFSEN
jgi:5,10-methylenetetrahydromethanopterin reductase